MSPSFHRNRTRISRALIVLLGVVIVVGVVSYLHNARNSEHVAQANEAALDPAARVTTPAGRGTVKPAEGNGAPAGSGGATTAPSNVANAIADGRAKIAANDLLDGRDILNKALISGKLSATDAAAAKQLISQANQTIVFSPSKFANDDWGGTYQVASGDRLTKIAAAHEVTWELLSRINKVDPKKIRAGQTLKVVKGPMHAVVDKSDFTIELYFGAPGGAGSMYITTYRVGLGRNDSTPTGTWRVQAGNKLKNPKFWGVADLPPAEAGDPKNPLGRYWIGLEGMEGNAQGQQSYGIHGTIEPDSIGKQSSHGCIRLADGDIDQVYEMLIENKSTVIVKD